MAKIVYSTEQRLHSVLNQIHYLDVTLPKENIKVKRPRIDRTIYRGQDYDLYKFEINVKNKLNIKKYGNNR